MKNIFILAFFYENEIVSIVLVIQRCFISCCCVDVHKHTYTRSILACFSSLPFTSSFLFYLRVLLLASSFRAHSLSLMHFCILPHEYATQQETYTSNKLSLDINRTLDFIKYFLFLTCFFFSSFSLVAYA